MILPFSFCCQKEKDNKSEAGDFDATSLRSLRWVLTFRQLVEERKENWGYFREEEKAV